MGMNEPPFELREMNSFITVAEMGSFTEAARVVGLSQSALTRQIQSLEEKMGAQLLSRTTRAIRLTEAGKFFFGRCRQIASQVATASDGFAERFVNSAPSVRVGVCSTVSLAYLPGFFHGFRRHFPDNQIRLNQGRESELIAELDRCALDVAIVVQPSQLPPGTEITHSFEDVFMVIGPGDEEKPIDVAKLKQLSLIGIDTQTSTGKLINKWLAKQGIEQKPMMEFDHFDLVINSVSLGLGYALVPRRSLAIYTKNRKITRHPLKQSLSRHLCALARSESNRPAVIQAFIDNILF